MFAACRRGLGREVQNLDNELMHLALGSGNAAQMMQAGRSRVLPPLPSRTESTRFGSS